MYQAIWYNYHTIKTGSIGTDVFAQVDPSFIYEHIKTNAVLKSVYAHSKSLLEVCGVITFFITYQRSTTSFIVLIIN